MLVDFLVTTAEFVKQADQIYPLRLILMEASIHLIYTKKQLKAREKEVLDAELPLKPAREAKEEALGLCHHLHEKYAGGAEGTGDSAEDTG